MAGSNKMKFHGWWAAAMGLILFTAWVPELTVTWREYRAIKELNPDNFMTVESIGVGNSVVSESLKMNVIREIHQDFRATYFVEVRTFPQRAVVCTASDTINYTPESSLPDDLTLEWWANDAECSGPDLKPGEYVIITTWEIHNDNRLVENQTVTVESNPFVIAAVSPEDARSAIQQLQALEKEVNSLRLGE